VRVRLPFDHVDVNDTDGWTEELTVLRFIGALNVTMRDAANGTPMAPADGLVDTMYGGLHVNEVNVQGFGDGPEISDLPWRSRPVIVTVYGVHCANGVEWTRVRTVSPADHEPASPRDGPTVQPTEARSIASLNVTVIGASFGTSVAPDAGAVETIYGLVHTVEKPHGLGTGPAVRGSPVVSFPVTVTVYAVHSAKSDGGMAASDVLLFDQNRLRATNGPVVTLTVAVSIDSLKFTSMLAVTGTFEVLSAGLVNTMKGRIATVVNRHGFGTVPAINGFPLLSEPLIEAVYRVDSENRVAWSSLTTVSLFDHEGVRIPTPGTRDQDREAVSIGLLKVTTMGSFRRTPTAPSAGLVDTINGFGQRGVKDHGLGARPVTSGLADRSCPAICMVFVPHGNGAVWLRRRSVSPLPATQVGVSAMGGTGVQDTEAVFIALLNCTVISAS